MNAAALEQALAVAERACDLARAEIMPRFHSVAVEFKSDGSPVTEADRAAERAIRDTLREAYPDFGILGEEYGAEGGGATSTGGDTPQWIIDPIDGTVSFVRGIPLFGTLIALLEAGESVLGVIDLPALGERYVGVKGAGCRRDGTPVRVSEQSDLSRSFISVGDPICFEWAGRRTVFERISREVPLVRGYTDAFGHALVLCGRWHRPCCGRSSPSRVRRPRSIRGSRRCACRVRCSPDPGFACRRRSSTYAICREVARAW